MAAILGGGLGGLSTGYYLLKHNVHFNMKLFLMEATDSCGGWIKSIRTKDYVFEQGPRTIRPKGLPGLNTLNMLEDLGLSEHIAPIKCDHPAAMNRMIYANKALHMLPTSFKGIFLKNEPFTKPLIYAVLNDLRQPHIKMKDDSVYNFVQRRFGKEIADYAISPMICGICAGDAKEISVKFLMKTLFDWEQTHGGVIKGLFKTFFNSKQDDSFGLSNLAQRSQEENWNVYTIKGGLETLPKTLHERLDDGGVNIAFNRQVTEIEFINSGIVRLKSSIGESLEVNHVYATIPSFSLANLVEKQHPDLAFNLRQIPFVTVGIVNLFYDTDKPLINPAFGFLVPPIEDSPILGVVFDSCCIPDQKGTVLTVMLGGKWFESRFGKAPDHRSLYDTAMKEVQNILKIRDKPDAVSVNVLPNCIPQYVIGHYERVADIRKYILDKNLPISLVGCSYDGVGMNDVIYSAKTQVNEDFC